MSRIVFVHTSQLISLMTAIHVKLHPSNPTFCMVLRNGLIVRRITYEPNRVRANVTINITHDYPPCETSPVTPEYKFFHIVLRNGLIVRRITLWALSCSCKRHMFLISLQLFTLHPHQATRFSSSSMISSVFHIYITKMSVYLKHKIIRTHVVSIVQLT